MYVTAVSYACFSMPPLYRVPPDRPRQHGRATPAPQSSQQPSVPPAKERAPMSNPVSGGRGKWKGALTGMGCSLPGMVGTNKKWKSRTIRQQTLWTYSTTAVCTAAHGGWVGRWVACYSSTVLIGAVQQHHQHHQHLAGWWVNREWVAWWVDGLGWWVIGDR